MTNVEARDISALYPRGVIRVLAGCPPCQPFSTHTQKDKDRSKRSAWGLLDEFSRVVHYLKPDIVTLENVPRLTRAVTFERRREKGMSLVREGANAPPRENYPSPLAA